MRTNIDIDDQLMAEAMAASGARTKREAVERGLRALLRDRAVEEFRALRGKMKWVGDLDDMRTSKWL